MLTRYYTTAIVALAGLVSAVPTTKEPIQLQHDDVILPRADGGFDIMKDWEWSHVERRMEREARARAMELKRRALAGETIPLDAYTPSMGVDRRDCEESTEVQVLNDTTFTDWDVAMSPVIGATGGQATVMVTKGYQVANAMTVSASFDFTLIKDVFKETFGISTTETWTTTDQQTFTYWVTPGQYGAVVSNPLTRRLTGNYLTGCTDSPTVSTFVSDSRTSQTFGELSWVAGPIKLCNSSTYPIPFCIGTGVHS